MTDRTSPIEIIGGVARKSRGHTAEAEEKYRQALRLVEEIKQRAARRREAPDTEPGER